MLGIRQPFPKGSKKTSSVCAPKGAVRLRLFVPRLFLSPTANVRVCSGWAPAHAVGLAVPPASPVARVWLVPSSISKGFARLVPRPLPFAPSLAPSAPSASVSRGSPAGFRLAQIAVAGPLSIRPSFPRPAVPPCASPLTASAPRGGGFRAPLSVVALIGGVPPPRVSA